MQELSLNILDIAQNSVKAGASEIAITVETDAARDKMTITVCDNGCGMDEEAVKKVSDPFFTSRTTRKVGLGVPFFKMAAELTGGGLQICSKVGEGTIIKATFGLSHIDRMPLGDMAQTICCLMSCNPQINIIYTRVADGQEFSCSTAQFTGILGEVPLNLPQVAAFIESYIRENTETMNA